MTSGLQCLSPIKSVRGQNLFRETRAGTKSKHFYLKLVKRLNVHKGKDSTGKTNRTKTVEHSRKLPENSRDRGMWPSMN